MLGVTQPCTLLEEDTLISYIDTINNQQKQDFDIDHEVSDDATLKTIMEKHFDELSQKAFIAAGKELRTLNPCSNPDHQLSKCGVQFICHSILRTLIQPQALAVLNEKAKLGLAYRRGVEILKKDVRKGVYYVDIVSQV